MSRSSQTQARRFTLNWRGLTPQVLLFVVLPLTALLVVIPFGSLALHSRAMRSLVAEREDRTVNAAADAILEQLNHRAAAVRGLALHAVDATSLAQALADYAFLLSDFEGGLALYSTRGSLLAASASTSPEAWRDRPVAELLTRVTDHGGPQFSSAFVDRSSGGQVMLVAAAKPNGPVAVGAFLPGGVAGGVLGDAFPRDSQVSAWLADNTGQLLYTLGPPRPDVDLAQHPGVISALRGEGGVTYLTVAGREYVVAFHPIPPVGWALVIEEPWEAVDNPLLRQTQAAPLILIPALLFVLLVLVSGIRQIVQPLQALERRAAELGQGRFEAIEPPVGGIGEIKSLQQTLVQMAQKIRAYQDSMRSYVGALTRGQEDERRRLARELHDDTAQALIALDQRVQMAQMAVRKNAPEAAVRLAEIRQLTAVLIDGVRRVTRALRPIYLEDLGLLSALEMLARDLEKAAGVQATFVTEGKAIRLTAEREIAVYRIAQEALSNVARHAGAKTVHVSARFEAHQFTLRVQDDGRGFSAPEQVSDFAAGHYGLIGMQERAGLVGGQLSLISAPGTGTTVQLRLPL